MSDVSKASILVVDDEEEIRLMLQRYFSALGYSIETAENGIDALNKMCDTKFDIVITDIIMPVMDGVQLLKNIKDKYPMVRVICITGYLTLTHMLNTMKYGADTCVFKPLLDLNELVEAVEDAVKNLNKWQLKLKELGSIKG